MIFAEDFSKRINSTQNLSFSNCVQLINMRYVIVSGHKGLMDYTKQSILVKLSKGSVSIEGNDLVLLSVGKDEIYVEGLIRSINVNDNEKTS